MILLQYYHFFLTIFFSIKRNINLLKFLKTLQQVNDKRHEYFMQI